MEIATYLVKMGADFDLVDFESKRPIDLAIEAGHKEIASNI
jgi:hypothetical protein